MRGERRKLEEGDCNGEHEKEAVDISKLTMIDMEGYRTRSPPLNASEGWPFDVAVLVRVL